METTGRRLPAESMTVLSRNRAESGTNVSAAGFFSAARSRWKTCGLRAPLPLPNDVRRLRALEKKKKGFRRCSTTDSGKVSHAGQILAGVQRQCGEKGVGGVTQTP